MTLAQSAVHAPPVYARFPGDADSVYRALCTGLVGEAIE